MALISTRPRTVHRYLDHIRLRPFSTTTCWRTHYETLGLPEGASKSQIKSHFYKLSKKHHPDVSKDPDSPVIFRKASEAYAVLSNDRERRAYDRSLLHRSTTSSSSFHAHPSSRGQRATHAWERSTHAWETRRAKRPPPDFANQFEREAGPGAGRHYTPPSQPPPPSPHTDVLTGWRLRKEEADRERDKIEHQPSYIRGIQVLGLMVLSALIFKGFS